MAARGSDLGFGYGGNSKAARIFSRNTTDPLPLSLQSHCHLQELCPLFTAPRKQHRVVHCERAEPIAQSKPGLWQNFCQAEEQILLCKWQLQQSLQRNC